LFPQTIPNASGVSKSVIIDCVSLGFGNGTVRANCNLGGTWDLDSFNSTCRNMNCSSIAENVVTGVAYFPTSVPNITYNST